MINQAFFIVNLILISVASFFSVNTAYKVVTSRFEPLQISESAPKPVKKINEQKTRPLSYYNAIASRDIFQSRKDEKKEASLDVDTLKETELKLKLWGTVTGDREKAYAVIGESQMGKEHDLYRIDDTIKNTNAVVKMILREKVVLSINNEDQVLVMEEAKPPKKDLSDGQAPFGSGLSMNMDGDSPQSITLERSMIEESLQNINDLMRQVRVRPHFTNGEPDGLALSSIRRNSVFSEMGLRNGDVITGVDGNPIQSVDDALKFYESISSASSLNLQVKRRGKIQSIDYTIR